MDEYVLLRVSLVVAAAGLVALLLVSAFSKLPVVDAGEFSGGSVEQDVRIRGIVREIHGKGNYAVVMLERHCPVQVVFFRKPDFSVGDEIEVFGRTRVFRGNAEIVAEKYSG